MILVTPRRLRSPVRTGRSILAGRGDPGARGSIGAGVPEPPPPAPVPTRADRTSPAHLRRGPNPRPAYRLLIRNRSRTDSDHAAFGNVVDANRVASDSGQLALVSGWPARLSRMLQRRHLGPHHRVARNDERLLQRVLPLQHRVADEIGEHDPGRVRRKFPALLGAVLLEFAVFLHGVVASMHEVVVRRTVRSGKMRGPGDFTNRFRNGIASFVLLAARSFSRTAARSHRSSGW